MTAFLVGLAMAGWVAAAYAVGLYRGEVGRREAAERREATGSPLAATATRLPDLADPEGRMMSMGQEAAANRFSEDTIKRGIDQLVREAKVLGRPLPPEEARQQVLAMLAGGLETGGDLLEAQ